jgi:hypothetical protein
MTALESLRGLILIDEVQRHPDLFPILRVLSDRKPTRARFLILGNASPKLLQQSSETLAGPDRDRRDGRLFRRCARPPGCRHLRSWRATTANLNCAAALIGMSPW